MRDIRYGAKRFVAYLLACASVFLIAATLFAAGSSVPGVSASEIKIGQTMPYSGPVSSNGTIGKAQAAYFAKINAKGGINGRTINFLSLDDGYSPPKAVEQTRKLVEQDGVFLIFGSLGTAVNSATQKYLSAKQVPQLLITSASFKWNDPKRYPWTMAMPPSQKVDASLYARYLLKKQPNAKIGVLYQYDDFGKDYLKALRDALGPAAGAMIVSEKSYEVTDPSIDSQIIALQTSGADTLFAFATPKFAAQTIRKVHDMSWRPLHFVAYPVTSVESVLKPAGLEKAKGLLSATYLKDPFDPQWQDDAETKAYLAWMKTYYPDGNPADMYNVHGYTSAYLLAEILQRCGATLTRTEVMKQAANLKEVSVPMLLPGIKINTSASDFAPVEQMRLARFDGTRWVQVDE